MEKVIKYIVRASNSYKNFSLEFDNLHDAEVSVKAIHKTNETLLESHQPSLCFSGYVTEWIGYKLNRRSWVTESNKVVLPFN